MNSPKFTSEDKEKAVFTYDTLEFRNAVALTSFALLSTTGVVVTGYPAAGQVSYNVPSTYFDPKKTRIDFNARAVGDVINGVSGQPVFLPYLLKNWGVIDLTTPVFRVNGVQRNIQLQQEFSSLETSERINTVDLDNLQIQVADYSYYNTLFFSYAAGAVHYLRLTLQAVITLYK